MNNPLPAPPNIDIHHKSNRWSQHLLLCLGLCRGLVVKHHQAETGSDSPGETWKKCWLKMA